MRGRIIRGMHGPFSNPVNLMNCVRFEAIGQTDNAIARKIIDDVRYAKFIIVDSDKPYMPAEHTISVYIDIEGTGAAGDMEYHVRLGDHKSETFNPGISHNSGLPIPLTKIFRVEYVNEMIMLVGSDGFTCQWSELNKDTDKPRLRAEENNVDLSIGHRMQDPAYYISRSDVGDIANRIRNGVMETIAEFLDGQLVTDL